VSRKSTDCLLCVYLSPLHTTSTGQLSVAQTGSWVTGNGPQTSATVTEASTQHTKAGSRAAPPQVVTGEEEGGVGACDSSCRRLPRPFGEVDPQPAPLTTAASSSVADHAVLTTIAVHLLAFPDDDLKRQTRATSPATRHHDDDQGNTGHRSCSGTTDTAATQGAGPRQRGKPWCSPSASTSAGSAPNGSPSLAPAPPLPKPPPHLVASLVAQAVGGALTRAMRHQRPLAPVERRTVVGAFGVTVGEARAVPLVPHISACLASIIGWVRLCLCAGGPALMCSAARQQCSAQTGFCTCMTPSEFVELMCVSKRARYVELALPHAQCWCWYGPGPTVAAFRDWRALAGTPTARCCCRLCATSWALPKPRPRPRP
jgi:hypothetical protein